MSDDRDDERPRRGPGGGSERDLEREAARLERDAERMAREAEREAARLEREAERLARMEEREAKRLAHEAEHRGSTPAAWADGDPGGPGRGDPRTDDEASRWEREQEKHWRHFEHAWQRHAERYERLHARHARRRARWEQHHHRRWKALHEEREMWMRMGKDKRAWGPWWLQARMRRRIFGWLALASPTCGRSRGGGTAWSRWSCCR